MIDLKSILSIMSSRIELDDEIIHTSDQFDQVGDDFDLEGRQQNHQPGETPPMPYLPV